VYDFPAITINQRCNKIAYRSILNQRGYHVSHWGLYRFQNTFVTPLWFQLMFLHGDYWTNISAFIQTNTYLHTANQQRADLFARLCKNQPSAVLHWHRELVSAALFCPTAGKSSQGSSRNYPVGLSQLGQLDRPLPEACRAEQGDVTITARAQSVVRRSEMNITLLQIM